MSNVLSASGKSFIIFDIETTGFYVEKGDEVLEIGAEKLEQKAVTGRFHSLLRPIRPIPPESTRINGITQEMVDTDGRSPQDVIAEFLSFAGDAILVGHNIKFDLGFVNAYARKFNMPVLSNQTLDTCDIARKTLIIPSYSLERVAQYFGIQNDQAHRALADVAVTRKVFLKLLDRALSSRS